MFFYLSDVYTEIFTAKSVMAKSDIKQIWTYNSLPGRGNKFFFFNVGEMCYYSTSTVRLAALRTPFLTQHVMDVLLLPKE